MRIAILLFAAFMIADNLIAQEDKSEGPYTIYSKGVQPPIVLSKPLPTYTERARQEGIEGIVLIQVLIHKDGTVDTFKILRGLGYGLDESAINTIATKWRFKPGTLNGNPVDVYANIEVSFRLSLRPGERESLQEYPLRVHIMEAKWNRKSNGDMTGSGYGNLGTRDNLIGFVYDCSCGQPFGQRNGYPAKFLVLESRIEMALGFDESTGKQKVCELHVTMQNVAYTPKDGQPGLIDQQDKNQK
jgi:TonB family protein